ncbi:MAG: hypothetical protein AAFQ43_14705 [Bacteroidota bacterium]
MGLTPGTLRLTIAAHDRAGRPLALDDGPIPSAHLVLSADATLSDRIDALAKRLAR